MTRLGLIVAQSNGDGDRIQGPPLPRLGIDLVQASPRPPNELAGPRQNAEGLPVRRQLDAVRSRDPLGGGRGDGGVAEAIAQAVKGVVCLPQPLLLRPGKSPWSGGREVHRRTVRGHGHRGDCQIFLPFGVREDPLSLAPGERVEVVALHAADPRGPALQRRRGGRAGRADRQEQAIPGLIEGGRRHRAGEFEGREFPERRVRQFPQPDRPRVHVVARHTGPQWVGTGYHPDDFPVRVERDGRDGADPICRLDADLDQRPRHVQVRDVERR